jgi:hypothetical protein
MSHTLKTGLLGALVALGLTIPALAADKAAVEIGNANAVSDLEERIAELEATVARKGNRKVKLTVSGWVAEQIMWWDDGKEQNVYVGGLGRTLASHVKFSGEALITPNWSAGFVVHLEAVTADPLGWSQADAEGGGSAVEAYQTYWFIRNKTFGKVSVGKQSTASDNAALLVDGSGSVVPANWVMFDNASFYLNGAGGTWGDLAYCNFSSAGLGGDCTAGPQNAIRYDSPEWQGNLKGFSFSASWGGDDFWDATVRQSFEAGGFKVAGAVSYARTTGTPNLAVGAEAVQYAQGGLYLQHMATGLFAYGAYGQEKDGAQGKDGKRWYAKVGARERWNSLGHTVLYAEYGRADDMFNNAGLNHASWFDVATSSEMTQMGLGLVQEIDSAAMTLWLSYRRYEGEFSGDCWAGSGCIKGKFNADLEDFQVVKGGALINF